MDFFPQWLKNNRKLLRVVQEISLRKKIKPYLVGGVLRDIFLRKEKNNPDFDFCLRTGAINFARAVAGEMKAGFVVLDKAHNCARVVKKEQNRIVTLDFSDFRGKTLAEDLLYRDFTINSMAVPLDELLCGSGLDKTIIDFYGGRNDLGKKLIRIPHRRSFDDDPLRIMRAFSFSAVFNFEIDCQTFRLAVLKKKKLSGVSWERIRDEFFKILSSSKGYKIIELLDKYGILSLIFPEIAPMKKMNKRSFRRLDVWGHTMLTLKNTELLISRSNRNPGVKTYLSQEISSGRTRAELLKLAALLHDLGKPKTFRVEKQKIQFHGHERLGGFMAGDIAQRLKLSNEENRFLKKIVFLHLRPGYLVTNAVLTPKAKYRFFRDAGAESISVLILALADERSTKDYLLLEKIRERYERVISRLLKEYFIKQKVKPVGRLVNGNDIMNRFKLPPSPVIGKVLRELEELQAIGRIKTKKTAMDACSGILKKILG